jgi:iron complex transport system ATP-binding protein
VSDAALFVDAVTAGYGPCDVLRDVTLAVARGEIVGLLGPNGVGKSTLLRVASGVLAPRRGRVLAGGRDVAGMAPRERARLIAVLPQETAPAFPVSVLATVLLGRTPWHASYAFEGDDDVAAAVRALEDADAAHLRDRDLSQLSGGERQRVLLARALCQGGDVLLCDEPTAHLDLRHQAQTFGLLRRLARDGRAVVVATHDLELAAATCDRLLLAGPRGVVACGTPAAVLTASHVRDAFGIDVTVREVMGIPRIERTLGTSEGLPR